MDRNSTRSSVSSDFGQEQKSKLDLLEPFDSGNETFENTDDSSSLDFLTSIETEDGYNEIATATRINYTFVYSYYKGSEYEDYYQDPYFPPANLRDKLIEQLSVKLAVPEIKQEDLE